MEDLTNYYCAVAGATTQKVNDFDKTPLEDLPLTMAYVPLQRLGQVYEEEKALSCGTLFPELDKPFIGKRWVK